jgi:hypothetical protein
MADSHYTIQALATFELKVRADSDEAALEKARGFGVDALLSRRIADCLGITDFEIVEATPCLPPEASTEAIKANQPPRGRGRPAKAASQGNRFHDDEDAP